jgi:hypothetical protein
MVAHTCNPTYLGLADPGSRLAWAKNYQDPISTNKPGMLVHVCNPIKWEA